MFTPTRQHQGQVPSALDLWWWILCEQIGWYRLIGKSDHCMVEFEYICYAVAVGAHIPGYLYDFGDYQEIVAKLLESD